MFRRLAATVRIPCWHAFLNQACKRPWSLTEARKVSSLALASILLRHFPLLADTPGRRLKRAKVLWREVGVTWDVFLFNGEAGSVPARRHWRRADHRPGIAS